LHTPRKKGFEKGELSWTLLVKGRGVRLGTKLWGMGKKDLEKKHKAPEHKEGI